MSAASASCACCCDRPNCRAICSTALPFRALASMSNKGSMADSSGCRCRQTRASAAKGKSPASPLRGGGPARPGGSGFRLLRGLLVALALHVAALVDDGGRQHADGDDGDQDGADGV